MVKTLTRATTVEKIKQWQAYCTKKGIKSIDGFEAKLKKKEIDKTDAESFFVLPVNFKVDRFNRSFEEEYLMQKKLCFTSSELKFKCYAKFQKIEHGRCLTKESVVQLGSKLLISVWNGKLNLCFVGIDSIVTIIRLLIFFESANLTTICITLIDRDKRKLECFAQDWGAMEASELCSITYYCEDVLFIDNCFFKTFNVVISWLCGSLTPLISLKLASLQCLVGPKTRLQLLLFTNAVKIKVNAAADAALSLSDFMEQTLFCDTVTFKASIYDKTTTNNDVDTRSSKHLFSLSSLHQIKPQHPSFNISNFSIWKLFNYVMCEIVSNWKSASGFTMKYFDSGVLNATGSQNWKLTGIHYSSFDILTTIGVEKCSAYFKECCEVSFAHNFHSLPMEMFSKRIELAILYFIETENILLCVHELIFVKLGVALNSKIVVDKAFWNAFVKEKFKQHVTDVIGGSTDSSSPKRLKLDRPVFDQDTAKFDKMLAKVIIDDTKSVPLTIIFQCKTNSFIQKVEDDELCDTGSDSDNDDEFVNQINRNTIIPFCLVSESKTRQSIEDGYIFADNKPPGSTEQCSCSQCHRESNLCDCFASLTSPTADKIISVTGSAGEERENVKSATDFRDNKSAGDLSEQMTIESVKNSSSSSCESFVVSFT